MNCPVCNSNNTELRFKKAGFGILKCLNCTHCFTDFESSGQQVKQIYSNKYFFSGGAGYNDYTVEKDMLINRGEYYADKLKKYLETGKMLDVGAAAGFILKGFINSGWKGKGVEPNASMVEYGVKNLGVSLEACTLEEINIEETFDLIVMIQVAAHLYDLHGSIQKINHLLKEKGYVLIETWNKDSLTARLFGRNWHEYSPPSTLNYFSKKTLNVLLTQHGFTKIAEGRPKKKIHSSHAISLLNHVFFESKMLKWMKGVTSIIPKNKLIPYPFEDLFWALYKKTN